MIQVLDNIILSDNVVNDFHKAYLDSAFKKWIISILPEIESCANTNQDNPWHIYNVLDHILHSIEAMNKQTKELDISTRRILAYTMLLHDIGKPETKTSRYSKKYGREVDSFFGHNLASMNIANRVLKIFNFNDHEIEIIKTLVKEHDMFMFITLNNDHNPYHYVLTMEYLKEKIEELDTVHDGQTMMKYLTMVGRSDNLAQNPEMTASSLVLLDHIDKMLNELNNTFN